MLETNETKLFYVIFIELYPLAVSRMMKVYLPVFTYSVTCFVMLTTCFASNMILNSTPNSEENDSIGERVPEVKITA